MNHNRFFRLKFFPDRLLGSSCWAVPLPGHRPCEQPGNTSQSSAAILLVKGFQLVGISLAGAIASISA